MANAFENAITNLEQANKYANVPKNIFDKIKKPEHIHKFTISANGKKYDGYRVQHNSSRGPYKGGIRFHPQVNIHEVKALATWMSLKSAIIDIPLGGGKGGVTVDAKKLTPKEKEAISRGWARAMAKNIGPRKDVPAPDVNTDGQVMAWIMDEYEKIIGHHDPGVITGKPIELGGSLGRDKATSQGGYFVLREALKDHKIKRKTVAIQGMGNVGAWLAEILHKNKFKVVAVSDSKGGIYNPKGIDVHKVLEHKRKTRSVINFPGSKPLDPGKLLELDVDILAPSALENVITKDNASKIKAKIVLEMANGPITPDADNILKKNNILVIPDVLANAGGVTVSYFELVQNLNNYYWDLEEVDTKLERLMTRAYSAVNKTAKEHKITHRTAANVLALTRLSKAMQLRGW